MRFIASTSRVLGRALFVFVLALVLFVIVLSGGGVLDLRKGAAAEEPTLLAVSLFCWAILLTFGVKLTVGRWKHKRDLKRLVLLVLLLLPLLAASDFLLPEASPEWVRAVLFVLSAIAANFISNRVVPYPVTAD